MFTDFLFYHITRNSLCMRSSFRIFRDCFNKTVFLLLPQLVGEIDLTTCHRVSELHDQRNFAFEIRVCQMIYFVLLETFFFFIDY